MLTVYTLWKREIVRFYRQRSRVIGALVPPFILWAFIGSGLSGSFNGGMENISYLQYFFPGTVVLVVFFTSIFSTISIIEDRKEGFLQSVIVSPAPRWAIALGKISGGATLAFVQGLSFMILALFLKTQLTLSLFCMVLMRLALISIALTALGFLIAWGMDSTQGYHSIMNIFLMPMWFLSGAVFPMESAPLWLKWIMRLNPLSYGVSVVKQGFYPNYFLAMPVEINFLIMAAICIILTGVAAKKI